MSQAARKVKTSIDEMPKPKDSGDLRFYGDAFPLRGCTVGETVTLSVKAKITSVHSDQHSSGVGFDIKSVEKYK